MAMIYKRKNKKGIIKYCVQARYRNRSISKTFISHSAAIKWARQAEIEVREEIPKVKCITFKEMVDIYIYKILDIDEKKSFKLKKTIRQELRYFCRYIGNKDIKSITYLDLVDLRSKLKQDRPKLKNITINKYFQKVNTVLNLALQEDYIHKVPKLSRLPQDKGRTRFLSTDELSKLLKSCEESDSKYLKLIVILAIITGARKSNILRLKWKDIDLIRNYVFFDKTKNNEAHSREVPKFVIELLIKHKSFTVESEYIFPHGRDYIRDIKKPFSTALQRAGIKDFRFHDLRHSCASFLAQNGSNLKIIKEVLGHKSLQMTDRYSHLLNNDINQIVTPIFDNLFKGLIQ